MWQYCRELNTDIQVEKFVDDILVISPSEKRDAINRIAHAQRNIFTYNSFQTLDRQDCRDFGCRSDVKRENLRKKIIEELFAYVRLSDEEQISLNNGGARPLTEVKCEQKAYYVIGPPASGKSGICSKISDKFGCYILDSDYAKRKLPEYNNQIGGASLVHEESNKLIFHTDGLLDRCLDINANIVIPKIGHDMKSIRTFCEGLKKANYHIYLISVDLDRQKATQRAYKRFVETNRYVPLSLVFDGYGNDPTLNYFKLKQQFSELFDGFCQISTDCPIRGDINIIESINMDDLKSIKWREVT